MATKTQLAIGGASAATASAAVGTGVVLGTGGKGEKIEVEDFNETINKEDKLEDTDKESLEEKKEVKKVLTPKEKFRERFPGKPDDLSKIRDDNADVDLITPSDYLDNTLAKAANNQEKLVNALASQNEWWWELSFNEKFEKYKTEHGLEKIHTLFRGLTKPYEAIAGKDAEISSIIALNQACHVSYKKDVIPFYTEEGLFEQTRRFCAIGREGQSINHPHIDDQTNPTLLSTVSEFEANYKDKFAYWGENKTHLVSGTTDANKKWWIWKYIKDFSYDDPKEQTVHNIFLRVNLAYSASSKKEGDSETTLNQACEEAYKQESEIEDKLQKNIKDYCISGSAEEVTLTFKKPS